MSFVLVCWQSVQLGVKLLRYKLPAPQVLLEESRRWEFPPHPVGQKPGGGGKKVRGGKKVFQKTKFSPSPWTSSALGWWKSLLFQSQVSSSPFASKVGHIFLWTDDLVVDFLHELNVKRFEAMPSWRDEEEAGVDQGVRQVTTLHLSFLILSQTISSG